MVFHLAEKIRCTIRTCVKLKTMKKSRCSKRALKNKRNNSKTFNLFWLLDYWMFLLLVMEESCFLFPCGCIEP
jgi:hypothetical protein